MRSERAEEFGRFACRGRNGPNSAFVRFSFPGRQGEIRTALGRVTQALAPLRLTPECAASAELVLAEVLNNIVEHAYADRQGRIDLELRLAANALACSIVDTGAPMPDGTPPSGRQALVDVPLVDLPEGGFGWYLIRSLTRDLDYRREGGRNRLTFILPLERCSK